MYKKGFISGYFIFYAILIFSLITIIFTNSNQYKIARYNIQKTNEYLGLENYIIRSIQAYIEEDIDLELLQLENTTYQIKMTENTIYIDVFQPLKETIIITLVNHKVYDYEVIRNELSYKD